MKDNKDELLLKFILSKSSKELATFVTLSTMLTMKK